MNKPTREELEIFLVDVDGQFIPYKGLIVDLVQAYLAQEEELKVVESEKHTMCRAWGKQNQIIEQLEADNQALKATLETHVWTKKEIEEAKAKGVSVWHEIDWVCEDATRDGVRED